MEHTFPILPPRTLCEFLEDLKFPMDMEDLKHPSTNSVRDVYLHFIEMLTGVTWEQMQQPQLQAAETLTFPELHKESIPQLTFIHHLSTVLGKVGCPDFTPADLNKPSAKRLICHLSALINFARFREDVMLKYEEYSAEVDEHIKIQQQLQKHNNEKAAHIKVIKEERAQQLPQVEALQKEIEEATSDQHKLNKHFAQVQAENDGVNKKMADRNAELAEIKFKMIGVKQEISELQGQCVSSPEKLRKNIRDLGHSISLEKDKLSEESKKLHKLHAKSDALEAAEKELGKVMRQVEEIEAEVTKYKDVLAQIDSVRLQKQEAVERGRDVENQLQTLNRQVASGQEKAVRQEKQHQTKVDKASENLRVVQEETNDVLKERSSNQQKDELNAKIAKKIQDKIQSIEAEHERSVAELTMQVGMVQESMAEYHTTVQRAMAMPQ